MNNKDPFLEKLETLINKMENIKSDFENLDTNSFLSATCNALDEFLNDGEKEKGDTDYD